MQFTAGAEVLAKLREAQALLKHQIPDGDLEQIFDRALEALLTKLRKQKLAATDRPRGAQHGESGAPPKSLPSSRHIPAAVRRAVWARDGGQCAFVSTDGRRCAEEAFLEFHHVVPYAHGGPSTTDNIELRCRAHNRYEAECRFGRWGHGRNAGGACGLRGRRSCDGAAIDEPPRPGTSSSPARTTWQLVLERVPMICGAWIARLAL